MSAPSQFIASANLSIPRQPGSYAVRVKTDGTAVLEPAGGGGALIFDVTESRFAGTAYQNVRNAPIFISGYFPTPGGGSVGNIAALVGATSGAVGTLWKNEVTATEDGGAAGFGVVVPTGYWYEIEVTGDVSGTPDLFVETVIA